MAIDSQPLLGSEKTPPRVLQALGPLWASKVPRQWRPVILGTVCAWERDVLLSEPVLRGFQQERNQLNGERLDRKPPGGELTGSLPLI